MVATPAWMLELGPRAPGALAPARRLLGLSVPLRLALSAASAGATAIVVPDGDTETAAALADARLSIPVVHASSAGAGLRVRVPADWVVHRGLFAALVAAGLDADRDLARAPFAFAPPFGFEPVAVVDDASARRAERALLRSLRKPQDGWTSTYLNRHISLAITRWLVRTPLRPNQVSVAILGVGILGAWLATRGTWGCLALGALCFQAQSVLDGCDGEMSRITFRGSRTGEWLDTVGDDLTNYGFFAGAAWGLSHTTGHALYLALGAVTVACGVLGSGIEYRYLIRIGSGDLLRYPLGVGKAPGGGAATSSLGRLVDALSPLFKRDTFVLLTLLGALAGPPVLGVFLAAFAAGAVGVLVAILKAEARMARERRAA